MKRIRSALSRLLHERPRRTARRAAQRGLTLLEIMIVIAILGLVMGLFVVPKLMDMFGSSRKEIAKIAVDQFANKDANAWAMTAGKGKSCPESLSEITGQPAEKLLDPWDSPYLFFCGPDLPAGVKVPYAAKSLGPDKKDGTDDDIMSWK